MESSPNDQPAGRAGGVARWEVVATSGPAGPFHAATPLPDPSSGPMTESFRPQLWIHKPTGPALVLGSTQPFEMIDSKAAEDDNVEVCRRRSGGGLVFIDPVSDCWIDLIVPTNSRFWSPDIGRAFHWVGEHWSSVVADCLGPEAINDGSLEVHRERTERRPSSGWCFGQTGHGEVSFEGRKVVGLSQRRTRHWTRIQSIFIGTWPAEKLRRYVDPERLQRAQPDHRLATQDLDPAGVSAGLGGKHPPPDPQDLARRFVKTIPAP